MSQYTAAYFLGGPSWATLPAHELAYVKIFDIFTLYTRFVWVQALARKAWLRRGCASHMVAVRLCEWLYEVVNKNKRCDQFEFSDVMVDISRHASARNAPTRSKIKTQSTLVPTWIITIFLFKNLKNQHFQNSEAQPESYIYIYIWFRC